MLASWLRGTRGWRGTTAVALMLALAGAAGCGEQNTTGRSPSYLVVESIQAASGAKPSAFSGTLESDVVTNVSTTIGGETVLAPTVYEDIGQAKLRMALKDVGTVRSVTTPTATNLITVTRYHVEFKRSDGRNTQGVDVPYAFDGAASGTFGTDGGTLTFALVRAQAKLEAPLKALRGGGGAIVISSIAELTFYGQDQNGNQVSVTGSISVNFADWGDSSSSEEKPK
ncbi:MAG: hypothetical protein MUE61_04455 [Vicinamibacterales bacterium]|nr:hypothetical protein [Vicinamibacterales bacterium]